MDEIPKLVSRRSTDELIKKIEDCNFECEAGSLVNNLDWRRNK